MTLPNMYQKMAHFKALGFGKGYLKELTHHVS